ncbi:MAG: phosphoribosylaminoimidazolesuccinocarboxamide synthase [Gammaproteobacteria bacterium]|nr:phosphoribosylaminoimidazolesuccinocarboxamide synthase [Gammaproteobacteria bacterium]
MNYNKLRKLYSGKAKTVYQSENPDYLIMHFRDDTSAFDGVKKAAISGKGRINNLFNAHVMNLLAEAGIPIAFEKVLNNEESLVKNLSMLPVECVVRNYTAGSICRRYNIVPSIALNPAMFEFFFKNDELHDPLINEDHILAFGWANSAEITEMRELSLKVNSVLNKFFNNRDLILVDFKLEFGKFKNKLYLGDEFTPDGCRIWDKQTKQVYDKDLFRKDLGDLVAGYTAAAEKLGFVV